MKNISGPCTGRMAYAKVQFWKFLAKKAKIVKIIKKAHGTFFSHLQALTKCKVSEKINKQIPRKSVPHARTDATPKVSNDRGRETKNFHFRNLKNFPSVRKGNNYII